MGNNKSKPHAYRPLSPSPPIEESTFVEEQSTVQSSAVSQPATPDAPVAKSSTMDASGNPPRYEETAKAAHKTKTAKDVEKFVISLETVQHPKDLLGPLLSTALSLDKKWEIMDTGMKYSIFQKDFCADIRKLEAELEAKNHDGLAQLVSYTYHLNAASWDRDWFRDLIKEDIRMRWIIQRIAWIHSEFPGNLPWSRLTPLHRAYWESHRRRWALEDGIYSLSAARGFARQRKHPDWYLSEELREDCAGRGGCCGRSCGCCEKPRLVHGFDPDQIWIPNQIHGKGHCTSACHCCLKVYCIPGNSIVGEAHYNEEIQDLHEVRFKSKSRGMDPRSKRLIKGYLFRWPGMK